MRIICSYYNILLLYYIILLSIALIFQTVIAGHIQLLYTESFAFGNSVVFCYVDVKVSPSAGSTSDQFGFV